MKRHKWKKVESKSQVLFKDDEDFIHLPTQVYECVQWELRKGSVRTMGWFSKLCYFRNEKLSSVDTIPYECGLGMEIREVTNDDFIRAEEFYIWW